MNCILLIAVPVVYTKKRRESYGKQRFSIGL